MKRIVLLLFIVFSLQGAVGQEYEMIRHEVQLGETVRMISRKYKVEPSEIYRLNKFAVDGISQGMVLQLMVPKKETPSQDVVEAPAVESNTSTSTETASNLDGDTTTTTTKKVTTTVRKKKQTTEQTQTTTEDPVASDTPPAENSSLSGSGAAMTHTVAKGETLFSIARQYNISVDEIKSQNEKVLKKGLQPGQVLAIIKSDAPQEPAPQSNTVGETPVKETVTSSEMVSSGSATQTEVKHKVAKGETLFSLSKKYNVSVDDIKMQNEQALKKGLQVGQVLTIKTNN
jgi:LysM repeat protein